MQIGCGEVPCFMTCDAHDNKMLFEFKGHNSRTGGANPFFSFCTSVVVIPESLN